MIDGADGMPLRLRALLEDPHIVTGQAHFSQLRGDGIPPVYWVRTYLRQDEEGAWTAFESILEPGLCFGLQRQELSALRNQPFQPPAGGFGRRATQHLCSREAFSRGSEIAQLFLARTQAKMSIGVFRHQLDSTPKVFYSRFQSA